MARFPRALLPVLLGLVLVLLAGAPAPATPAADDPVFAQGLQWGLARIGAPDAWAVADGSGVTIAVVDSGVDLGHEDLAGQIAGHVSCVGSNGRADRCSGSGQDDDGHGTHVAGIALAATGNGVGVAGVAPGARLLAVRALAHECNLTGCTASGSAADVSAGIRWAVRNGADIVNLSLGGGLLQAVGSCPFCAAIEDAWRAGVIVVVAAGNDSILPAGFDDEPAVVVTATNRDDRRASYSNASSGLLSSARWPVAAPGGEAETNPSDCGTGGRPRGILSTYWTPQDPGHGYACLSGTSMAAPHVSGALAVLLSTGLEPRAAIDRLLATATDLGPSGRDSSYGAGRIDLARAVGPRPPTSTTTGPTPPTTGRPPGQGADDPVAPGTSAPAPPAVTESPPTVPPEVAAPSTPAPAPFDPDPPSADGAAGDRPAPGLVAIAVLAVAGTAAAAATAARRLRSAA